MRINSRISLSDEQQYEDEDGTAIEEYLAVYSVRLPNTSAIIYTCSVVLVSILNLVWSILKPSEGPLVESCLFLEHV